MPLIQNCGLRTLKGFFRPVRSIDEARCVAAILAIYLSLSGLVYLASWLYRRRMVRVGVFLHFGFELRIALQTCTERHRELL